MNKINNYHELQAERERLQRLLSFHKKQFSDNITEVKKDLETATSFIKLVGKATSRNNKSETVNVALDLGGQLLKKTLLSRLGWFPRLVLPFLAKNIASHVIADSKNKKLQEITAVLP